MKKLALAIVAALILFASCSTVTPVCATSNPVGSKVGEATATYLFGYIPLGSCDMGIQKAAKQGGITLISTVDSKVSAGLFTTKITTVVTGE